MRCPYCRNDDDRVIDSRSIGEGSAIRRRRECVACAKRFTTYERAEVAPLRVIKKDSSRESFKREKILKGLMRATEKRNISAAELENIVSRVESRIFDEHDGEVSTKVIGEIVIQALRDVDHVAYVRFASVYREFKDVEQFLQEVISLARPEQLAAVSEKRGEPSTERRAAWRPSLEKRANAQMESRNGGTTTS